jgi:hypothetical protein
MTHTDQLYFVLGYCLFMLVIRLVFLKFPPKNINSIYGYRTARSMKSQKIWDAANSYWTRLFFKRNSAALIIPLIPFYSFKFNCTIVLLATIPSTEKHLAENFDKDGNPI